MAIYITIKEEKMNFIEWVFLKHSYYLLDSCCDINTVPM